ncbi:MAG: cupin domain-containing protein [Thermoleophilaceae bacterium]|nr:cupin domain-containing protein [Thermoleophilaceae bacterium]
MSHPDPNGPPELKPIRPGDVWENPVTKEVATVVQVPWSNPEGRTVAELLALAGAQVVGEHRHPGITEKFTAHEGELTVKLNGETRVVSAGESVTIPPNAWHDWWNATDKDVRVTVEVTPGERFIHMIETLFGLGRSGHTNAKGMPDPLQLALFAREFRDVFILRRPPLAVQRVLFGTLAPIARARGYRATYPQFSSTTLAPRD